MRQTDEVRQEGPVRGPGRSWAAWLAALLLGAVCPVTPLAAQTVDVDVVNASTPTRCAEEDNVYVKLQAPAIGAFRIVAEHPPYIGSVRQDSTAPEFSHCDMSADPRFEFTPQTVVLHEDARIRLVGHTFASFWRPDRVDFRVGDRVVSGLHLVQLLRREPAGDIEILVVYPSDGYWRPKPLPPPQLPDSAYGSSFLVGPIEERGRPLVALRSIRFDPALLRFELSFAQGSGGVLTVRQANRERTELEVLLDPPVAAGQPFAALRSMFVTPGQADVARASWTTATGETGAAPIMQTPTLRAASVRFGRVEPSQHNLSAPDLVFEGFARAATGPPPRAADKP